MSTLHTQVLYHKISLFVRHAKTVMLLICAVWCSCEGQKLAAQGGHYHSVHYCTSHWQHRVSSWLYPASLLVSVILLLFDLLPSQSFSKCFTRLFDLLPSQSIRSVILQHFDLLPSQSIRKCFTAALSVTTQPVC